MSHRPILPTLWLSLAVSSGVVQTGCSSAAQQADAPRADGADGRASQGAAGESMSAMGETGALNKADVQATFQRAMPSVNRCVAAGRERLPFLSGDIEIFLRIDVNGRADAAIFTQSTLGDHRVEDCILKVFRGQQWPRPVGGRVGEVVQTFGFSRDPDEEAPLEWTAESLAAAMAAEAAADAEEAGGEPAAGPPPFAELEQKLDACRREAGVSRLQLTMHFDEDGMPRGVGLSSPDEGARKALECVKTTIETTSFPSPRSNFAKMTLTIP